MSRDLVTLHDAYAHLRIDDVDSSGSPHDAWLEGIGIPAASEAVINYIKQPAFLDEDGQVQVDSAGDPLVPPVVRAATLLMLGYLFRDRDSDSEGAYNLGELPRPVTSLLYPLRTPALA